MESSRLPRFKRAAAVAPIEITERDRNIRKNLAQTSFYRKLLAYEATWSQGIHRSRFGFNRFRVLTVTTSAERVKSLVDACSQLKRGHGLFLFTDRDSLKRDGVFSPIWKNGRGEIVSLLN